MGSGQSDIIAKLGVTAIEMIEQIPIALSVWKSMLRHCKRMSERDPKRTSRSYANNPDVMGSKGADPSRRCLIEWHKAAPTLPIGKGLANLYPSKLAYDKPVAFHDRELDMIVRPLLVAAMTIAYSFAVCAQPRGNGPPDTDDQRKADLVLASRILVNEGVLDSFGHVSVRSKTNPNHFYMPRAMPPALVTLDDLIELDMNANPVAPGPRPNGEKFIHSEIYKARPDVQAVVHSHSPAVIPFSMNPDHPMRPVLHTSVFLPEQVKVFDMRELSKNDPGLAGKLMVNTNAIGAALAKRLGSDSAILLRSHGNAVVGESLPWAVLIAVYMQQNAKTQMEAEMIGQHPIYLDRDEIALGRKELFPDRPWDNFKARLPRQ